MIYIVGLGSGSIGDITLGTFELLKNTSKIYFRTEKHPLVIKLGEYGIKYEALDRFYIENDDFELVYSNISEFIVDNGRCEDIVYAVPGHPMVAEKSVTNLIKRLKEESIEYKIISAMSFLDPMFTSLEVDMAEGFTLLDALNLETGLLTEKKHIIITQVYDSFIASDTKLILQDFYKDEEEIILINGAGIEGQEEVCFVSIENLDRVKWDFNHLTSIFIKKGTKKANYDIYDLMEIVKKLRGEDGCPWDRAQTRQSLVPMLIEEAEEVKEAIEKDDIENLIEELGDLLLHIVMQSQLGLEDDLFNFSEITEGIVKKMIRRHPHVFGDDNAKTLNDVNKLWNFIKNKEKEAKIK
ncbi:MAG: MazG nucleotide pyrophosphohydrolase domain-containing protein [Filifactoraceae bacterium]